MHKSVDKNIDMYYDIGTNRRNPNVKGKLKET